MKKLNFIIKYGLALLLLSFYSCESWLNVTPSDRLSEEMLFNDREGFVKALNGVYIELNTNELYGRNLTAGALDVMGQYYSVASSSHAFYNYGGLVYTGNDEKALFDNMWQKCYAVIACCNTIIEKCDENKAGLSPVWRGSIKGEALALRAMLHFDMLRLFSASPAIDKERKAIPYLESYTNLPQHQLTVGAVLEKVVKDLNAARELMREVDPYGPNYAKLESLYRNHPLLRNRQKHLNYYAVLGLKARICLYAKDVTAAYGAANEVILAQQQKGLFPWVKTADITTTEANLRDRTFSSEHLFAFNTTKLEEYIKGYFREASLPLMERLMPGELYEADDYRTALYETYSGFANVLTKFWQMDKAYVQGQGYVTPKRNRMPAIRIAEMYYIAAEALKESNIGEALEMLNTLRVHRGLMKLENLDKDQLQEELGREYYREFIGEGQVFFYHKRMNTSIIATANAVYVLPMPDDEIDLGQREQ